MADRLIFSYKKGPALYDHSLPFADDLLHIGKSRLISRNSLSPSQWFWVKMEGMKLQITKWTFKNAGSCLYPLCIIQFILGIQWKQGGVSSGFNR